MKHFKTTALGVVFGILCLLSATAAALGFIHLTGLPYRIDIKALHISEESGFSEDIVIQNYQDAMRFLSPFRNEPFTLTDLKVSPGGAQHFEDTKVLFNGVYVAGLVSLVAVSAILLVKRRKNKRFLLTSSITTLAVPLLLSLVVMIDFDAMFLAFHAIFFNNDLWMFDPRQDEIIKILPAEFFMHCVFVIVAFWIVTAAIQFIIFKRNQKVAQTIN